MYTFAVIVVYLIVVAMVWFLLSQIMMVVQAVGRTLAMQVGSVDSNYIAIDSFYTTIFQYFLVIAVITLIYWVFVYSQLKGRIQGE